MFTYLPLIDHQQTLDSVSILAIILSGATIFTTIQTQDFPDVAGDRAIGRITLPIYAPHFSRWLTLIGIPAWSAMHCWIWGIGAICSTHVMLLGLLVGGRFFHMRTPQADSRSYVVFNVRCISIISAHKDETLTGHIFRYGSF